MNYSPSAHSGTLAVPLQETTADMLCNVFRGGSVRTGAVFDPSQGFVEVARAARDGNVCTHTIVDKYNQSNGVTALLDLP